MTRHTIPTTARPDDDAFGPGHYTSEATLLIEGSRNRAGYALGGWTKDGMGRLVHEGPMVQGPHAYIYGEATVIARRGGTSEVLRQKDDAGLLFRCKAGDTLDIAGTTYTLTLNTRGYPSLQVEG